MGLLALMRLNKFEISVHIPGESCLDGTLTGTELERGRSLAQVGRYAVSTTTWTTTRMGRTTTSTTNSHN